MPKKLNILIIFLLKTAKNGICVHSGRYESFTDLIYWQLIFLRIRRSRDEFLLNQRNTPTFKFFRSSSSVLYLADFAFDFPNSSSTSFLMVDAMPGKVRSTISRSLLLEDGKNSMLKFPRTCFPSDVKME